MAGAQVLPPFPVFTDVDGNPVDDGYIYVGQEGLDPIASPVSVFWDRALTVPATQPIRTIGGYPSNAGVRSVFYSSEPVYSILVRNKNGTEIYSDSSSLSSTDLESRLADSTDPSKGAALVSSLQLSLDKTTPYNVLRHIPKSLHASIIDRSIPLSTNLLPYLDAAVLALYTEHGGGILHFPQGLYPIQNHFAIPYSNITLMGYGAKLFCDQPTSGGETLLFWFPMSPGGPPADDSEYIKNNFVYGLTVENTSPGTNENAIAFVRCDGFGAYDCHIEKTAIGQGANRKGIVTHWCRNGHIENNIIDEAGFAGIAVEKAANSKNIWICRNYIKKVNGIPGDPSTGFGIYMSDSGEVGSMSGIYCEGNIIDDVVLQGIFSGGLIAPSIKDNKIGISGSRGIHVLNTTRPVVRGNTIDTATLQGVLVQSPVGPYEVDDNVVLSSGAAVGALVVTGPDARGSISGNKIYSPTLSTYIDVQTPSLGGRYPDISGNIMSGGAAPIFSNFAIPGPGRNIILGLPYPGVWISDNFHSQTVAGVSTATSVVVPANSLGSSRSFSVVFSGTFTNSAGANKIARVKFGGVTIAELTSTATSTFSFEVTVLADGSTAAQRVFSKIINGATTTITAPGTTVDTALDQTIAIEAETAGAGEVVFLRMMKIRGLD